MTIYTAAYDELTAALHSVSFTAYVMEMEPTDKHIEQYERALDAAEAARRKIGEIHAADMQQRSIDASLAVAVDVPVTVVASVAVDMRVVREKHEAAVFSR